MGDWRLCDDGDRAALNGVGDELRAVHVDAGVRDEKGAGDDVARVGGDAGDFEIGDRRFVPSGDERLEIGDSNCANELGELHCALV